MRSKPNILIAGTPGTGKTTLAQRVASSDRFPQDMKLISLGDFIKEHNCYEEWDKELECHVLDEDKLLDQLEPKLDEGGLLLEYHGCDLFDANSIDVVFVTRTNNTTLYDRLSTRGYSAHKLEQNIQCEIFQTLLDEARQSHETVVELTSDVEADIETNCDTVLSWIEDYVAEAVSTVNDEES